MLTQTSTTITILVYLIDIYNTRLILSPICRALIHNYVINIHLNIISCWGCTLNITRKITIWLIMQFTYGKYKITTLPIIVSKTLAYSIQYNHSFSFNNTNVCLYLSRISNFYNMPLVNADDVFKSYNDMSNFLIYYIN